MDIHQQIRAAREQKGWSMERLAKEVSEAEALKKPLSWQTVQQWENGTSAPKRTRMLIVLRLLGLAGEDGAAPASPGDRFDALDPTEQRIIENLRVIKLDPTQLDEVVEFVANKAAKLRAMQELIEEKVLAKYGIKSQPANHSADAKKTATARASLELSEQLRQRSLLQDDQEDT